VSPNFSLGIAITYSISEVKFKKKIRYGIPLTRPSRKPRREEESHAKTPRRESLSPRILETSASFLSLLLPWPRRKAGTSRQEVTPWRLEVLGVKLLSLVLYFSALVGYFINIMTYS